MMRQESTISTDREGCYEDLPKGNKNECNAHRSCDSLDEQTLKGFQLN
jgi:hypothetical protein